MTTTPASSQAVTPARTASRIRSGAYLIFNIGVQQVQTSSCIAVDPAFVIIFTQSHAALPKFVLDKRVRQQIVLRGLELPWRYNRYLQTGAFSLACQLGVERRRSMSSDGLAKMSFLERLEGVVLHNEAARRLS